MEATKDVIAVMPSGKVMRFGTIHMAKAMLMPVHFPRIFTSASDMARRLTPDFMQTLAAKLTARERVAMPEGELAPVLWELCLMYPSSELKATGRGKLKLVNNQATQTGEAPDEAEVKESQILYDLLYKPGEDPVQDARFINLTPQARAVLQVILDAKDRLQRTTFQEHTLFVIIEADITHLKTRQSKLRIFKYYRSALIARGFLKMRRP